MSVEDARLMYSEGNDFWAGRLLNELDESAPGSAFNWAKECMDSVIATLHGTRPHEQCIWQSALNCGEADSLMLLAEQVEGDHRDALSIALANLIVAKRAILDGEARRGRRCLMGTMRNLANFCRESGIEVERLFSLLPA